MIFHCMLLIMYNKLAKPFDSPLLNHLEIFNELSIMLAAYHLFAFTNYVDNPQLQYQVGWSMIGVTAFNILVNMCIMGYQTWLKMKQEFRRLVYKYKNWRASKVKKEDIMVAVEEKARVKEVKVEEE
jgi:hypothetical protein